MRVLSVLAILAAFWLLPAIAAAGEADVEAVEAVRQSDGTWRFNVTVRHADEGWSHYADRWEVVAADGRVLGTRVLLHPHEAEQPFTRSLGGVVIPDSEKTVTVRAHDSVHRLGGAEVAVDLER